MSEYFVHPTSIVDDNVEIGEGSVTVTLAFSKHRDPLAEYLIGSAKASIIRNAPAGTQVEVKTIIKDAAPKKKPGLDLGNEEISKIEDYHSHNTARLDVEGMKQLLLKLRFIREDLGLLPRTKSKEIRSE